MASRPARPICSQRCGCRSSSLTTVARLSGADLPKPSLGQQKVDRFGEVVGMGPDDDRLGQPGDFHYVRPAHRHQAAADEHHRRQRVKLPQFTHRVAQKHRPRLHHSHRHHRSTRGTPQTRIAALHDQPSDLVECLGLRGMIASCRSGWSWSRRVCASSTSASSPGPVLPHTHSGRVGLMPIASASSSCPSM